MPEDSTSLIQEVGALTADIPEAALWLLVHAREPPKACRPTLGSEAEAGAEEQRSKQTDQESARRRELMNCSCMTHDLRIKPMHTTSRL